MLGNFFRRIGAVEASEGFVLIPPGREVFFPSSKEFVLIINGEENNLVLDMVETPIKHHRLNLPKLNKGDVIVIKKVKDGVYELIK